MADFVIERMEGTGLMHADIKINLQDKAEKRLDSCLGGLKKEAQVVLVVDGLDEVSRRDGKFAEEIRWLFDTQECCGSVPAGLSP